MDFAEGVVAYFVDRRGKGASVSALDQHELLRWERDGVPMHVVLAGIDDAFARRKEPPKSVRDCKRWVTAQQKLWTAREGNASVAVDSPGPSREVARALDAGGWRPVAAPEPAAPPEQQVMAWLAACDEAANARERGSDDGRQALQAAVAALRTEVDSIVRDEGMLPTAMLLVLDDALVELVQRGLPAPVQAEVRVAAAKAANAARERELPDAAVEAARRRGLGEAVAAVVRWPAFSEVAATTQ